MTDPRPNTDPGPVDPDVELASAHLDGEAGPDERARVGDPAVQGYVSALTAVVAQVRDVPPAPPGLLDEHVARALEDFDVDDDSGATVVSLDARRTRLWERIPLGAVAAALVVVALVGALGLASRAGDDDSADTATAALESVEDGAGEAGATAGGGAATADERSAMDATLDTEVGAAAPSVAAYDSFDALADDLRAELGGADQAETAPAPAAEEESTAANDGADADDPCGAVGVLGLDPATVVLVRTVLVAPDQVTVVVHDAPDGRRLAAVDASCTVVLDRLL